MTFVGAPNNQSDRNFVMHELVPLLLEAAAPYMANADTALLTRVRSSEFVFVGADARFKSFQPWAEWLTERARAYQPELNVHGYDVAWAPLASATEQFGHWLQTLMFDLGLGYEPDRYSEALHTLRRAAADEGTSLLVVAFLSALRGTDEMPGIMAAMHAYADSLGVPDWRVAVPPTTDHFHQRRFMATLTGSGGAGTVVFVYATGTSASRLVWRVYADESGREYLGQLASKACEGWRAESNPERTLGALHAVPDDLIGTTTAGQQQPRVTNVRDITTPCDAASYRTLLSCVRSFVGSKYADGHLETGEAWNQAVVMPQRMTGIHVTRTDLHRALREVGWVQDSTSGMWYYSEPKYTP